MKAYYETNKADIMALLKTQITGLSSDEAKSRLEKYGFNKLPESKPKSYFQIFLDQFKSPLIYLLFGAAAVVYFLQETTDAAVIFFVLLFNATVGMIQEGKAQNTLRALRQFVETKATILRDGSQVIVSDVEIVPGDIVMLEEGDKVPADLRIVKSNSLRVDESSLTGESESVYKIEDAVDKSKLSVADQRNMAFRSTHVVAGNGIGVVIATGINTEIGKISKEIISVDAGSPLKADIASLSKLIIWTVFLISIVLFVIGIMQNKPVKDMFTTVVALSVSVIPEGLPIVMTLVLATGVWRMSQRHALVKKLQAVESLGQAKVIALDKTGTITKNEMVVKKIYALGQVFAVTGDGYDPRGKISSSQYTGDPLGKEDLKLFFKLNVLSANAHIVFSKQQNKWLAQGDPTQAAMVCLGQKFGFKKEELENTDPRVQEIPFDYKLKYHILVNKIKGKDLATMVAAPEVLLKASILSQSQKDDLSNVYEELSAQGLRVIGIGYKYSSGQINVADINNFNFLGFVGIQDTIRPEATSAISQAEHAGLKVVMITGDNKTTALAIAKTVGIYKNGDQVLTGQEVEKLSEKALSEKLDKVSVFARITPEYKLKIIKAYQRRHEIIAMTGDGVNDAPSLVAADLGIAMGKIGTEVAKEASDIVLLDDNFGTIVAAIDEGRNIYKTIKKVILYLFSTSFGEVLTIGGALILGFPLPILASQIIWLNFVTDGFLDVSLAMEPKEDGLLRSNFQFKKYLLDSQMIQRMFVMAIPMMIGSIAIFKMYYQIDMVKASTMTLTLLAVFQWFNAWNCRHESKSVFQMNPFSNKWLVFSTITVFLLQILAVYHPFMQKYLHTTSLNLSEWIFIVSAAGSIIVFEEIRKLVYRLMANE
jgi:Ca2+-transporting ATPase